MAINDMLEYIEHYNLFQYNRDLTDWIAIANVLGADEANKIFSEIGMHGEFENKQ